MPRTRKDGDEVLTRVPVDRKRRVNPAVVDLIASDPVPAYDPPAGLTDRDLIKVLTTRTRKRWTTIEADFGQEQAWRTTVSLIRCGAVVLRCKVVQTTGFTPDSWQLTPSWASLREDKLAQLRGHPDPSRLHAELLQAMAGIPQLASEHALLAATAPARTLQVPAGSTTGTEDWRVYEVAVRSAAVWWAAQSPPRSR
ncbi:hypothetical protein [Streptomyces sp. NPDC127039]|uniref:hypothetical protein n=1 Tax=Streptomyces sp. NPDC127039 TaxID=3347115 RepID=UPI0036669E8E